MTNNEFVPVRVVSTSAWDEPLEVLVTRLKAKGEEIMQLADRVSQKLAEQKLEQAKAKPLVPQHASSKYGFLLPSAIATNFNVASAAHEVTALPSDIYKITKPGDLEDFRTVLNALANAATHDNNRNAMFFSQTSAVTNGQREMAEGKSPIGFNLAAITASNGPAEFAHLFVVEDSKRGKMVVCGPSGISSAQKADLAAGGVTYVSRQDNDCAAVIDDFLAEGAKWRADRGMLISGNTQNIIENLIHAFSTYANEYQTDKGLTVGKAIRQASTPKRAVQITSHSRR